MGKNPADYRWSSYGEAVGGEKKGDGKKARKGLVRAYFCDQGVGFDAGKWQEVSRSYRRMMGLALGKKPGRAKVCQSAKGIGQATKNTAELLESKDNETVLKDLGSAKTFYCRIRYFTDGSVIGSKEFVNEAFACAGDRFGPTDAPWFSNTPEKGAQVSRLFSIFVKSPPKRTLAKRPAELS